MASPVLAQALYENVSESTDELEFRAGDIVKVIEFDTSGLDGWWLCELNNKQGIAPGNRLRLIQEEDDVYDTPSNNSLNARKLPWAEDEEYDIPTHNYSTNSINVSNNNNNDPLEVYDVPTTRKNWVSPLANSSYSSPSRHIEDIYDVPPNHDLTNSLLEQDIYDVPTNKSALDLSNFSTIEVDDVYDVPPIAVKVADDDEEEYDIPHSNKLADPSWNESAFSMISVQDQDEQQEVEEDDVVYDIPSSRIAETNLNTSTTLEQHINLTNNIDDDDDDNVYDVPISRDKELLETNLQREDSLTDLEKMMNRLSTSNDRRSDSSIDSCTSSIVTKAMQFDELLLDGSVATEMLIRKNLRIEDSVSHLLTLVYEGWRTHENLVKKMKDVKETFSNVLISVKDFLEFARRCFANGNNAKSRTENNQQPKHLVSGLYKLLMPIEEDFGMLDRAKSILDQNNWDVNLILQSQENLEGIPDEIDSFIMTSRAVSDDASQMASYIHTHMQYLFSNDPTLVLRVEVTTASPNTSLNQSRPLPDVPKNKPQPKPIKEPEETWLEDYDYVALEDQNDFSQHHHESPVHYGHDSKLIDDKCKKILERLEHANHASGLPFVRISIENNHVSQNYINEMVSDVPVIIGALHLAVKKFYRSIEQRDPPKIFVALSKQVVLCAHELVFFGDMLYKFLPTGSMQDQVKGHCTQLCTALKQSVTSTKLAALNWPAHGNIKDLVNKVSSITQQSYQFRVMLAQCTVR